MNNQFSIHYFSHTDFPKALMRLLKNKLLVFNNIASIFYILGSSGYITFMGRMMEVQFNTSSHGGSIITGPITIFGMTIGLLLSGYVITKVCQVHHIIPAPRPNLSIRLFYSRSTSHRQNTYSFGMQFWVSCQCQRKSSIRKSGAMVAIQC